MKISPLAVVPSDSAVAFSFLKSASETVPEAFSFTKNSSLTIAISRLGRHVQDIGCGFSTIYHGRTFIECTFLGKLGIYAGFIGSSTGIATTSIGVGLASISSIIVAVSSILIQLLQIFQRF